MSDIMLLGVLNMPPDMWTNDPIDIMQRHSRYIQAAKQIEELTDKMHKIKTWCEAYPITIFPEPDFKKAHEILKQNGMTLDAISASNMRHVLSGIKKIIDD